MANPLPPGFEALEPYLDWALASEPERYAKRLASTMEELQSLYDAGMPLLEDIMAYLEKLPLDDLPEDATHLLHIGYSLINVAFPIEAWKQPQVPDSGASTFDCIEAPKV